ncbi:hypothetical protein [Catellatospora sp. NPDC049609]|uniref:hypothetical protein n=1 Tax=Catellatospora sp. NPDC049609 TaxID=3155505 RepID=UPI003445E21D
MSTALREAFDDLVEDVAPFVVADDLGATAWRTGRRRRSRRLLARSALVVAATALAAAALLPGLAGTRALPPEPADRGTGPGVTGHPTRIEDPWLLDDLPDRPGPAAALLSVVGRDNAIGWRVVAASGHSWRLSRHYSAGGDRPTLSPDGRYLAYRTEKGWPYVIHDLVEGRRIVFRHQPAPGQDGTSYLVSGESPTYWSPDGTRLLVPAFSFEAQDGVLVLDVDGTERFTPAPGEAGGSPNAAPWLSAGWADDRTPAWVRLSRTQDRAGREVTVQLTDLAGARVRSLALRPATPWQGDFPEQWTATVSPDGRELLVLDDVSGGAVLARRFAMADGAELGTGVRVDGSPRCGTSWVGSTPAIAVAVPNGSRGGASTALLEPAGPRRVVAVDPALDSRCLVWAADALAGEARRGLFGMDAWALTWRWRELLVGALAMAVLAALARPAIRLGRLFRNAFR